MNTSTKVVIGAGIAALTLWVLKKKGVIGKRNSNGKAIVGSQEEKVITYSQNIGTMKLGNTIDEIVGSTSKTSLRYY